jgi:hypothetical protein
LASHVEHVGPPGLRAIVGKHCHTVGPERIKCQLSEDLHLRVVFWLEAIVHDLDHFEFIPFVDNLHGSEHLVQLHQFRPKRLVVLVLRIV